jgi:hypothetical protein
MNTVFHGTVKSGELILDKPTRYLDEVRRLEGKQIEAIIRVYKSTRSNQQNNAYWGILIEILSNHLGYDKNELHDALRAKFLSYIDAKTGLTVIRSTKSLNTKEFCEYYEKIQRWSAEFLQCDIPSPNEENPLTKDF